MSGDFLRGRALLTKKKYVCVHVCSERNGMEGRGGSGRVCVWKKIFYCKRLNTFRLSDTTFDWICTQEYGGALLVRRGVCARPIFGSKTQGCGHGN